MIKQNNKNDYFPEKKPIIIDKKTKEVITDSKFSPLDIIIKK